MKKTAIATIIALSVGASSAAQAQYWQGEFCMYSSGGGLVGGSCNTQVSGNIDTTAHTFSVASTVPFFGVPWVAHDGTTFGPGTYTFPTTEGGTYTSIVVGPGQVGGHILFDWGATHNIDVVMVWDVTAGTNGDAYTSTDVTAGPGTGANTPITAPDGVLGLSMIDGAFVGFNANFNMSTAVPIAHDDGASVLPGGTQNVHVADNDIDTAGNMPPVNFTVNLITATPTGSGATLTVNGNGTITYDATGSTFTAGQKETFQYTLTDNNTAVTTVPVTVTMTYGSNTKPNAGPVTFSTNEDTPKTIAITDPGDSGTIATDDGYPTPSSLKFDVVNTVSSQGGSVSVNATNDAITYTPAANFNGVDTISYTVTDGEANSFTGTMTMNVAAVNDPPVCPDVALGTPADAALSINVASDLLTGCTDVEGDTITLDSVTQPTQSGAMLANDGAGTLTYTPPPGYTGSDSFQFTATDGNGGFVTATVNIKVGQLQSNFTMLDKNGNVFGGTNDVVFKWDGTSLNTDEHDTNFGLMTIASAAPTPFFGTPWYAHHVRVFGPGTYYFETDNAKCEAKTPSADPNYTKTYHASADDIDVTGCPGTPGGATTMTLVVGPGQVGAHMLFDYNGSFDIDVINLWDVNAVWNDPTGQGDGYDDLWTGGAGPGPTVTTTWALVSRDANGDGVNGAPMVDGPFIGFYANFNKDPGSSVTVLPINETAPDSTLKNNFLGGFSWQTLLFVPAGLLMFRRRRKH